MYFGSLTYLKLKFPVKWLISRDSYQEFGTISQWSVPNFYYSHSPKFWPNSSGLVAFNHDILYNMSSEPLVYAFVKVSLSWLHSFFLTRIYFMTTCSAFTINFFFILFILFIWSNPLNLVPNWYTIEKCI